MKTEPADTSLKRFFDTAHLKRVAAAIHEVHPPFNRAHYLALAGKLQPLAMKARVRLLASELHTLLPAEFPEALPVLLAALRQGRLEGFDLWPVTEYIQTHGLNHWEISLPALREITRLFTSEWAIRPFLKKHPAAAHRFLLQCARDADTAVRRWASEGTRPRLPWGERLHHLIADPSATLPILELLKFDEELFVRTSVANHLNDIAKDHPHVVIQLLQKWQKQAGARHAEKVDWIVRRALRTLIKQGHAGALELVGVSTAIKLRVGKLNLAKTSLRMGEKLEFSCELVSTANVPQKLIIDYRIHLVRARQKISIKVFKLRNAMLPPGETLLIEKSHHFRPITTRRYYDGAHRVEIQVNSAIVAAADFQLGGTGSS